MNIIRVFVMKMVKENKASYANQLLQSEEGAMAGLNEKLEILLKFFHHGFIELFQQHSTGAERFS